MPAMVRRRRCPDVGAALQRYERPAGARVQRTARACVEQTWRRSLAEALAVIDLLDERIAPLHQELRRSRRPIRACCCCARFPASVSRSA
jgi:hypothetical protein